MSSIATTAGPIPALTTLIATLLQVNTAIPIIFTAAHFFIEAWKSASGTDPNLTAAHIAQMIKDQIDSNRKKIDDEIARLEAKLAAVSSSGVQTSELPGIVLSVPSLATA